MKRSIYQAPSLSVIFIAHDNIMNASLEQPYETEPEWDGISIALKMN